MSRRPTAQPYHLLSSERDIPTLNRQSSSLLLTVFQSAEHHRCISPPRPAEENAEETPKRCLVTDTGLNEAEQREVNFGYTTVKAVNETK